jgi:anti-anti-sigma factor
MRNEDNRAVIKVGERFDFSLHADFRKACEASLADRGLSKYVVDLGDTVYMDSSALGMLLVFRESVGDGGRITLANCRDEIREILNIANFQKLFEIN